jgi:hypothetical protein
MPNEVGADLPANIAMKPRGALPFGTIGITHLPPQLLLSIHEFGEAALEVFLY